MLLVFCSHDVFSESLLNDEKSERKGVEVIYLSIRLILTTHATNDNHAQKCISLVQGLKPQIMPQQGKYVVQAKVQIVQLKVWAVQILGLSAELQLHDPICCCRIALSNVIRVVSNRKSKQKFGARSTSPVMYLNCHRSHDHTRLSS